MASKRSEQRAARKEMVMQAELARNRTSTNSLNSFFGRAALVTILSGVFVPILCSVTIEGFDFLSAFFCFAYMAVIFVSLWIFTLTGDDESEDIKKAKLLREAKKEDAVSSSLIGIAIGTVFLVIGIVHCYFAMSVERKIDVWHLSLPAYILGTIAWGELGLRIIFVSLKTLIDYKKVLAEEAAGTIFVALPPDEEDEEFALLVAQEEGRVPFTNDSRPNNIDAENSYIDDPDYDNIPNRSNSRRVPTFARDSRPNNVDAENSYIDDPDYDNIPNRSNSRRVPTFARDSRPNNADAENSYIDDPDYDRRHNRHNCYRSPALQSNSRQSNSSYADDSFYDEVQY